jgi:hypothetical protein
MMHRQQIGSALAQAGQLAQAKAYPQRQGGQQNGNQQRKHEPARRVAQDGSHLHGGHAGVVHATYARPHQQAAQQQLPMADRGDASMLSATQDAQKAGRMDSKVSCRS